MESQGEQNPWIIIGNTNKKVMLKSMKQNTDILCLTRAYTVLVSKLEKAMAPHSSTLDWKIPWMEEPGGLQSMGLLRVGHD